MWTLYEQDVAYLLLADTHPGEAAIRLVTVKPEQQGLPASIADAVESLQLEFDSDNRLIAIEVWGAGASLPKSFLEMAARETRPKPIAPRRVTT
jgi:hypothetical protein